eukprot:2390059-Prorocentrum_lima.AAC.1
MTSSLVGSEMCIRDRLSAIRATKKELALRRDKNMAEHTALLQQAADKKDCLLYTSDAADDM